MEASYARKAAECEAKGCESCDACDERAEDGTKPYVVFQVARCQLLNGMKEEALASMERVVELQPDNETYTAFLEEMRSESNS